MNFCLYVADSSYFRDAVLDFGLGNGRDSFGVAKVVAVDQSLCCGSE
ncbi:hypothetical protein ACIKT0_02195 [Hansschlegelia beijingensis]